MKTIAPLLALAACCLSVCASFGADLTAEFLADLKTVGGVRLSPDGKWVTYVVEGESREAGKTKELWLASVDGKPSQRRLLPGRKNVSEARWSASGRLAVVTAAEIEPHRQLLLVDLGTEAVQVLVDRFEGSSIEWSSDGRQIGFIQTESIVPARKRSASEPLVLDATRAASGSVSRFFTLDVETKVQQVRTPPSHSVTKFGWSPQGDAIVALARSVNDGRGTMITVFPFAEGAAPRELWHPHDQTLTLAWSPDGKVIAWCGRELTPQSGQLVLLQANGDPRPRTVQADFPGSLHHIAFRADGRLAFGALENLRAGIYSVAADGSDLRADHPASSFAPGSLGVGSFAYFALSFSADGSRVATTVSGPGEPANVIAGPWRGNLTRRTDLNPAVSELSLGAVEDVSWRSFDQLEIHGFVIKPPGFDPAKKYPLVVLTHGGPRRSWWANGFLDDWWGQWIAHQGYMVFLPNPRGSEGRGADFVRANYRDLGGGDWRDVVTGLDHVLTLGNADPERLGLAGWSYGGFLAAWGLTQPEGRRFKVGIVGAGITNRLAGGAAASGWSEDHYGDPQLIWRHPMEHFYRSPIAHVGCVSAPTLILHGDNDTTVPHGQSMDFYNGLRAMGVPTEARIYPGAGHAFTRRDQKIDLFNSIARWLRTYLPAGAPRAGQK